MRRCTKISRWLSRNVCSRGASRARNASLPSIPRRQYMALRQPVYSCIVVLGVLALASCEQSLTDVGYEKWKSAPHYGLVPCDASGIPPADLSPAVFNNNQTYATLNRRTT